MTVRRRFLLAALFAGAGTAQAAFSDPLDRAASQVRHPERRALMGVVAVGPSRLVAVGMRGMIVVSDDLGQTWRQVAVPVSSDLVSVRFLNAKMGWATGHDGVILVSRNGGGSWQTLLDGRRMGELLTRHFEATSKSGDSTAKALLDSIKLNFATGPEQPVLGVWFEDDLHGWAVSTFGMLIGTQDGGKTWTSWMEQIDNPDQLHLYSIEGVDGAVYITSEKGVVFRLDRARQRFVASRTGFAGGLFGLVGQRGGVLAFGLQGRAFRSRDAGASWEPVDSGVRAGINAGVRLPDDRVVLVTQDGRLLSTLDLGQSFRTLRAPQPSVLTGVAVQQRQLVVVGLNGAQRISE